MTLRRSPLKRRTGLAKVSVAPRSRLKYLALELARVLKMVDHGAFWIEPDGGTRYWCREWHGHCAPHQWLKLSPSGVVPVQWCHVITRGAESLMCDSDNTFIGCEGCHRHLDQHWHSKRAFIIETYGADRMEKLETSHAAKLDLDGLVERLAAECVAVGAAEHVAMARERAARRGAR